MKREHGEPIEVFAYGENFSAKALYLSDGKIKVLSGSLISPFATNSVRSYVVDLRNSIILRNSRQNILTRDVIFENVSIAASVISGNMRSGNRFWMTADNIPLGVFLEVDDFVESTKEEAFSEGAKHIVIHDEIERNHKARMACLKYYGYKCQICGFDFKRYYGDDFEGIIQVHHVKPISEYDAEHAVDPLKDLIPVCPNCHVALHSKKDGVYTPEELRRLLNKRGE